MNTASPIAVLVLGASYGILPGVKMSLASHRVTLVGREAELAGIAAASAEVVVPARETQEMLTLRLPARLGPARSAGEIGLLVPEAVDPLSYDLILLAMQEPQYAAPEIDRLMARIAASRRPCLSIMNMPPPPFLARLPGLSPETLLTAYAAPQVWERFDPVCISLASPDPQAVRLDPQLPGRLTVTLATNFKIAPFADPSHQRLMVRMAEDVDAVRWGHHGRALTPKVRLVPHDSLFVPLAKWPMLVTGNCRCLRNGSPVPIQDAVFSDLDASRELFDWVRSVVLSLGAPEEALVSFNRYAEAAHSLSLPSSLARALYAGAKTVERIDLLVRLIASGQGREHSALNEICQQIKLRLRMNKKGR